VSSLWKELIPRREEEVLLMRLWRNKKHEELQLAEELLAMGR